MFGIKQKIIYKTQIIIILTIKNQFSSQVYSNLKWLSYSCIKIKYSKIQTNKI